METDFWALPGIEPGTLRTRVKDLNHYATLQLLSRNDDDNLYTTQNNEKGLFALIYNFITTKFTLWGFKLPKRSQKVTWKLNLC